MLIKIEKGAKCCVTQSPKWLIVGHIKAVFEPIIRIGSKSLRMVELGTGNYVQICTRLFLNDD